MPLAPWVVALAYLLAGTQSPRVVPSPAAVTVAAAPRGDTDGKDKAPPDLAPIRIGPILLTGYAQLDGLFPFGDREASQSDTFRIRRARVAAAGDLLPKIGFAISVDVTDSHALREVYVTLRQVRAANVRVGEFVVPYSLERLTSTKDLEAIDRVVDHLTPGRDMGAMVSNGTPFWGQLSYFAAVVNGTGLDPRDDNSAKDYVGRLVWRVPRLKTISIGANAGSGRQPEGMRRRWGADINLDRGDYRVAAEYVHQTEWDWAGRGGHGFYLLARRRFRPAIRRSDFQMLEAVVRVVDVIDPNEIVGGLAGVERREVQAGGNCYFSQNVRVMADAVIPFKRALGAPRTTILTRVQFMF